MTITLKRKRGRLFFILDTRPSKKIRRAKTRIEKRMREIHQHFGRKNAND